MLEAYLPKPVELSDETGVPEQHYILGRIKSVSDRQRMCYMLHKTARYTAKANAWQDVRCDYDTGRMWLVDQPAQFDERRGGYVIALPETLVGQRVYMRAFESKANPSWLAEWFLADVYDAVKQGIANEMARRGLAYEQTPIYTVSLRFRKSGAPVCDPATKKFVTPVEERHEMVFKGSDVDKMQQLVSGYWPSTWEREIEIHNLGHRCERRLACTCLPWNAAVPLKRVDQLV